MAIEDLEDGEAAGSRGAPARPTAIVIGAGFGGISAAGRLARAGYSVTCIEKHPTPGGRCCEIVEKGHRFDVGPSIILVPSAYREAFTAMGDDLDRHLDFMRVDPTYKIHFHDGTSLELTADLQRMEVRSFTLVPSPRPARSCSGIADIAASYQAQLETFESGSFKNFLSLIRQGHDNLHKTLAAIAHRNFYSLFEFLSLKNGLLIWKLGGQAPTTCLTRGCVRQAMILTAHFLSLSSVFKGSFGNIIPTSLHSSPMPGCAPHFPFKVQFAVTLC